MAKIFSGDLTHDTSLLPETIADAIVREGAAFVPAPLADQGALSRSIADQLADKAKAHYAMDCAKQRTGKTSFAGKMQSRGNDGRDYLYMFMRHWFAAIALRDFGIRAPSRFANGLPL